MTSCLKRGELWRLWLTPIEKRCVGARNGKDDSYVNGTPTIV